MSRYAWPVLSGIGGHCFGDCLDSVHRFGYSLRIKRSNALPAPTPGATLIDEPAFDACTIVAHSLGLLIRTPVHILGRQGVAR